LGYFETGHFHFWGLFGDYELKNKFLRVTTIMAATLFLFLFYCPIVFLKKCWGECIAGLLLAFLYDMAIGYIYIACCGHLSMTQHLRNGYNVRSLAYKHRGRSMPESMRINMR
jgi:hypothetical protein